MHAHPRARRSAFQLEPRWAGPRLTAPRNSSSPLASWIMSVSFVPGLFVPGNCFVIVRAASVRPL